MGLGKLKFKTGNWLMKVDNRSKEDLSIKQVNSYDSHSNSSIANVKNNKTSPIKESDNNSDVHTINTLKNMIVTLKQEKENYQSELNKSNIELKRRDEIIKNLEKDLEIINNKIEQLENINKEDLEDKLTFKQELAEKSRVEKEWNEVKANLEQEKEILTRDKERVQMDLDKITLDWIQSKKKVENLTFKEQELTETKNSLTLERDQLKIWLQEEKERHDTIRIELAELKAVNKLNLAKMDELQSSLDNALAENKKFNESEKDLEIQKLKDECQVYKTKLEISLKENSTMKDKLEQLQMFLGPIIKSEPKQNGDSKFNINVSQSNSMLSTPLASPLQPNSHKVLNEADELEELNKKLDALMEEKKQVQQAYSKIPITKVSKTLRAKQYDLERSLDSLDSQIASVRNRLRVLNL